MNGRIKIRCLELTLKKEVCRQVVKDLSSFSRHMKGSKHTLAKPYWCYLCGKRNNKRFNSMQHLRQKHEWSDFPLEMLHAMSRIEKADPRKIKGYPGSKKAPLALPQLPAGSPGAYIHEAREEKPTDGPMGDDKVEEAVTDGRIKVLPLPHYVLQAPIETDNENEDEEEEEEEDT